ncbi:hypothetical protein BGS_0729 [Beggiatoa sp. SS]|nr:hypothetical protein BGS_0729 [Beggiatoa sp. SS]
MPPRKTLLDRNYRHPKLLVQPGKACVEFPYPHDTETSQPQSSAIIMRQRKMISSGRSTYISDLKKIKNFL